MAKNKAQVNVNHYANQEEAIRKAKGNPNKNVHHKKKNSNYGGYTAGNYMAQKIMDKAAQQERVQLPTWLKIWLGVVFGALLVVLVLRLAVYKDSVLLNSLSSLLLGLACGALFYIRKYKHTQKSSALYSIITIVLVVMCVLYVTSGTLGLLGFQVFFFWGVQQAGVAVGTVTAIGFSPVMAAILARIILGERPARIWYPATGLALAGLVRLNLGSSQNTSTAALLLPLLAGACYGAYFVFSKPLGRTHAPEHIMLLLCAGSGLLLLPVHFCTPPLWLLQPQGMGMALYLGVVTAALAFSLTLAGLRRTPTAMAATLALVEPLGAACWGIFLLHEPVGGQELAGMGLLFGGVALLALGKKTENTPPTEEHASSRPLSGEGAPQH